MNLNHFNFYIFTFQIFNYDKHSEGIDVVIVDNGVTRQSALANVVDDKVLKNSDVMIYTIERLKKPVIYSLTDPRLKFEHELVYIFSQNDKYRTLHQDKLCLLSLPFIENKKDFKCIVVAMDDGRGPIYDKLITRIRKELCEVDVYGNLRLAENKDCHKGMISADKIGDYYSKYMFSLMVPIEKGWITQKYCESIHFGCVPITFNYDDNSIFFNNNYKYDLSLNEMFSLEGFSATTLIDELKVKLLPYYRMETWVEIYKKAITEVVNK